MTQVNLLAIDLSKNVESNSSQTGGADVSNENVTQFSDVMAQHQQQESGKNSQQSGKQSTEKDVSAQRKDDSTTSSSDNNEAIAEKAAASTEQAENQATQTADSKPEQASETKSNEAKSAEESSSEEKAKELIKAIESDGTIDIAQELLSFIAASGGTLTEQSGRESYEAEQKSSNAESKSVDAPSIKLNNEFDIFSSAKPVADKAGTQEVPEDSTDKSVQIINVNNKVTLVTEDRKVESSKEAEEARNTQPETSAIDNLEKSQETKVAVEQNLANTPVKKTTGETVENEEIKKLVNDEVKVQTVEKPVETKPAPRSDLEVEAADIPAEEVANTFISSSSGAAEQSLENDNVVKNKATSKEVTESESITTQKQVLNNNSVETNEKQVEPIDVQVKVAEHKNVENKNTEASAERVINKATNSVVSQQSNAQQQQTSSDEQSKQDDSKTQVAEEVVVREKQQVVSDKVANVAMDDKANLTTTKDSNYQPYSQQSISYAEEQALQQVMAKATADSVSVQSAKTAINIQNETISIYRKDFTTAVKDKVMVMINQKIKQLEIRLDPPELGSMQVKLNLQNEQAVVNIVVQNQQAKEALEQNMGKLKDMLSESGVDVGDANVEQQNQQTSEDGEHAHQSNGNDLPEGLIEQQMALAGNNLYKASATGVDYYA